MIHRNGNFIVGYMAGQNDRTANHPYNNWGVENLTPEYLAGYLAGFTGKGSVVIEMPDEITERLSVGDRVKRVFVMTSQGRVDNGPFLDTIGTIESIGTELGPKYISVKWDGNDTGFNEQVLKECLVKVD